MRHFVIYFVLFYMTFAVLISYFKMAAKPSCLIVCSSSPEGEFAFIYVAFEGNDKELFS